MGQFSQLIGSFERVGNFPLEAEYEFPSVEALHQWSGNEGNYAKLHPGLKKLVKQGEELIEYWVVERDGALIFEPVLPKQESLSEIFRTNIETTEYKKEDLILILTLKQGDYEWKETIPLNDIIETLKEDFAQLVALDDTIQSLTSRLQALQGQVDALIATSGSGGSGGAAISEIKILSFEFVSGKTTYIVDPNKLTDEEKENGVDIPIRWEYNINLNNNDKQYIYLDGRQAYTLEGPVTEFVIPGVKKSTTVKLQGLSKTYGIQADSSLLRITFGITVYVGGSANIDSLATSIITPQTDTDGRTTLTIPFTSQASDDFRYFAVPDNAFDVEDPRQLVLRDENNFVIQGYEVSTKVSEDGSTYYVYKLDNIIHGSFTIKISDK